MVNLNAKIWNFSKQNDEPDYGLKGTNEMDCGLKELRWNTINEVDKMTREELRLSDNVMMRYKQIRKHEVWIFSK